MLALFGGALGLALAFWGLDLLQRFANVPELLHAQIDASALLFIGGASILWGLLFGLGPAFSGSRPNLHDSLSGTTRSTSGATGARHALVFAEVALAAVLLIGCALMLRSFVRLMQVNPGFSPENVVTADTVMSEDRYPGKPQMLAFYRNSLANMRATGREERGPDHALAFRRERLGQRHRGGRQAGTRGRRQCTNSPGQSRLLRHPGHSAQGRRRFQRTR